MSSEMAIGMTAGTLCGSGLLIAGLYQRSKLKASQSWLTASGTIVSAAIALERDADSTGYSVAVTYNYVVNGATYTGQRIGFSSRTFVRKKRAEAELARYPVNAGVAVFFDPSQPKDAVLVRSYPDNLILIGFGILLLGIVAAGVLWGRG